MARQRYSTRTRRLLAGGAALALTGALWGGFATVAGAAGKTSPPTVKLGDNFFQPTKLTVTAGTKVTWTWTGSNTHNVTVLSGPQKFRSTDQSSGSYSRRLTKVGTYRIVCTFHPGMVMTLKVTKAPKAKGSTTTTTGAPPSS